MKESYSRILLLSVLGCVPLAGLLVLPLLVGGFVDELGLTERESGLLASASFLGGAAAALFISLTIHRLPLQRLAYLGLFLMALSDGLCVFADSLPLEALAALRFLSGVGGAGVYASIMGGFAGFRQPDRAYGLFMACQFLLSAVALYLLPGFMPELGATGLFAIFAIYDLLGLFLVRAITSEDLRFRPEGVANVNWRGLLAPASIFCLVAYGVFEALMMGQFAYSERIGVALNLTADQLGFSLGLASLVGVPAALAVTFLGSRYGQFVPIAAVALLQAGSALWLIVAEGPVDYLVIVCVFGAGWAFVLPYFQGICARLDPSGGVVVAGGFATSLAGFAGPAAAALLVLPGDYSRMLITVALGLLLVVALTYLATHRRLNGQTAGVVGR